MLKNWDANRDAEVSHDASRSGSTVWSGRGKKDAPVKIINHAWHRHSRPTWHEVWAGYHLPITLHPPCFWTRVAERSLIFQFAGPTQALHTENDTFRTTLKRKKKKKESEIIRDYLPQQRGTQVSTPVWRVAFHDLEMAKSNLGVDAGEKNKKRKNHCECPRLWWLWVIYYKTPGNTS